MSPVVIAGVGMCTPLGPTTAASEAAFRAGLLNVHDTIIKGRVGEPLRASFVDEIPPASKRSERMLSLADRALSDLMRVARFDTILHAAAFIGLPNAGTELLNHLTDSIGALLRKHALLKAKPQFFNQGRTAFFFALEAALWELSSGRSDVAVVGGIESLCAHEVLRKLDAENRLLNPALDGIIPGEGAAFILLRKNLDAGNDQVLPAGRLLCVSTGRESRHFQQSLPNSAQALSSVLGALRKDPAGRGTRADLLYTCETGERFWSQEFSLAYFRNTPIMPEPLKRTMAAQSFGDLGAAAGAVLLGLGVRALARLRTRMETIPHLLLCGSSDEGNVGACLVRGPEFHA
jgi:3-oxoacyl-[acyl-carrier-protein] synthase I